MYWYKVHNLIWALNSADSRDLQELLEKIGIFSLEDFSEALQHALAINKDQAIVRQLTDRCQAAVFPALESSVRKGDEEAVTRLLAIASETKVIENGTEQTLVSIFADQYLELFDSLVAKNKNAHILLVHAINFAMPGSTIKTMMKTSPKAFVETLYYCIQEKSITAKNLAKLLECANDVVLDEMNLLQIIASDYTQAFTLAIEKKWISIIVRLLDYPHAFQVEDAAKIIIKMVDNREHIRTISKTVSSLEKASCIALLMAAKEGNLEAVRFLVAQGVDVNTRGGEGVTPIFLASQAGYVGIIGELLKSRKIDFTLCSHKGESLIDVVMAEGNLEVLRILLPVLPRRQVELATNYLLKNYNEPAYYSLITFIIRLRPDIVCDILIKYITRQDKTSWDHNIINLLLHRTTCDEVGKNKVDLLEFLEDSDTIRLVDSLIRNVNRIRPDYSLEDGVEDGDIINLRVKKSGGLSILMRLAIYGKAQAIYSLLHKYARLETHIKDNNGNSAFLWAVKSGQLTVIAQFIKDDSCKGEVGKALLLAAQDCKKGVYIVRTLLGYSLTDINAIDRTGWNALFYAVFHGNLEVVKELRKNPKIQINYQQKQGKKDTALHIAVRSGNPVIIAELLQHHRIQTHHINSLDCTALMLAVEQEQRNVIEVMLSFYTIDVNVRSRKGTALDLAQTIGDKDVEIALLCHPKMARNNVEKYLLSTGSDVNINVEKVVRAHPEIAGEMVLNNLKNDQSNLKLTQDLLKYDIEPNVRDSDNRTPLIVAVEAESQAKNEERRRILFSIIKMLKEKNAYFHARKDSQFSAKIGAAAAGFGGVLFKVSSGGGPVAAATVGAAGVVTGAFIGTGLALTEPTSVRNIASEEVLKELTQDARWEDGVALVEAASAGRVSTIREILQKGEIGIDFQLADGNTALIKAAAANREGVVVFLLNQGANPNYGNNKRETALFKSIEVGSQKIMQRLLQDDRTNINTRNERGETPLIYILKSNKNNDEKLQLVRMLLAKEECRVVLGRDNVILQDGDNKTAIDYAFASNDSRIIYPCLKREAGEKSTWGITALEVAICSNNRARLYKIVSSWRTMEELTEISEAQRRRVPLSTILAEKPADDPKSKIKTEVELVKYQLVDLAERFGCKKPLDAANLDLLVRLYKEEHLSGCSLSTAAAPACTSPVASHVMVASEVVIAAVEERKEHERRMQPVTRGIGSKR
jgi:ankyrin repeat protein